MRVLEEPGPERSRRATAALRTLLTTAGADGAYLEIEATPLPMLGLGAGTLAEGLVLADVARTASGATWSTRRARSRSACCGWMGRPTRARRWPDSSAMRSRAAWSRAKVAQATERLAALDSATRGIANVLELDAVLLLIVEGVRDLVRARYAALGIVDSVGVIERFVTVGIDPDDRELIGQLPRGHGLLGLIIREGRAYPDPGDRGPSGQLGLPAPPPADALVPRRSGHGQGRRRSATCT